jgi:hypothetical protein
MYAQSSPSTRALTLAVTATLLGLVTIGGGCRDVASYGPGVGTDAALPDGAADLADEQEASISPVPDVLDPPDLSPPDVAPDTWPALTPGNCAGNWWIPAPTPLGPAKEAAVLAIPQGGWLVAWVDHADKVHFRRLDAYGTPMGNKAQDVPTAGMPAMLSLGLSNGEPLLAWSELTPTTGSGGGPDCERQLAFRYLDSKATCTFQYGSADRSLVEPTIFSGPIEAHVTAALIWECGSLPASRHSKVVPLRVVPAAASGADCTVEDRSPANSVYIGLTESYRPQLFEQPSGSRALSLLHQRQAGTSTNVPLELRLHPADPHGSRVLDVDGHISLGTQPSDGNYDAMVHDNRLWVAWERDNPVPAVDVTLVDSGTNTTPLPHATLPMASAPALFAPTNHKVPSIVHCDVDGGSPTHGLVVRRLPDATTDGSPGLPQLIREDPSTGVPRKPRAPKVAAQQDSAGVVWLEGSDLAPQLYFAPLFCQPSP